MKKWFVFGLMFLAGLLASPVLATEGIDDKTNCQMFLPYSHSELLTMRDHLNSGSPVIAIDLVNGCNNQIETVRLDAISVEPDLIRVNGHVENSPKADRREIVVRL